MFKILLHAFALDALEAAEQATGRLIGRLFDSAKDWLLKVFSDDSSNHSTVDIHASGMVDSYE